ncbi:hypothetical protein BDD12DRAFT_825681 [Trichophaea hybrida]|nr:hypothetical protein BDD12DRAFT_825681 [Trichophaea hybrida]
MRLQIHVYPAHAAPNAQTDCSFLEIASPSLTLEDLSISICKRYSRLYPHRAELQIHKLQDSECNDLDLAYTVSDVFSDKSDNKNDSVVRVIQASNLRESSIPPESALRSYSWRRQQRGFALRVSHLGALPEYPLSERSSKRQKIRDLGVVDNSQDEREAVATSQGRWLVKDDGDVESVGGGETHGDNPQEEEGYSFRRLFTPELGESIHGSQPVTVRHSETADVQIMGSSQISPGQRNGFFEPEMKDEQISPTFRHIPEAEFQSPPPPSGQQRLVSSSMESASGQGSARPRYCPSPVAAPARHSSGSAVKRASRRTVPRNKKDIYDFPSSDEDEFEEPTPRPLNRLLRSKKANGVGLVGGDIPPSPSTQLEKESTRSSQESVVHGNTGLRETAAAQKAQQDRLERERTEQEAKARAAVEREEKEQRDREAREETAKEARRRVAQAAEERERIERERIEKSEMNRLVKEEEERLAKEKKGQELAEKKKEEEEMKRKAEAAKEAEKKAKEEEEKKRKAQAAKEAEKKAQEEEMKRKTEVVKEAEKKAQEEEETKRKDDEKKRKVEAVRQRRKTLKDAKTQKFLEAQNQLEKEKAEKAEKARVTKDQREREATEKGEKARLAKEQREREAAEKARELEEKKAKAEKEAEQKKQEKQQKEEASKTNKPEAPTTKKRARTESTVSADGEVSPATNGTKKLRTQSPSGKEGHSKGTPSIERDMGPPPVPNSAVKRSNLKKDPLSQDSATGKQRHSVSFAEDTLSSEIPSTPTPSARPPPAKQTPIVCPLPAMPKTGAPTSTTPIRPPNFTKIGAAPMDRKQLEIEKQKESESESETESESESGSESEDEEALQTLPAPKKITAPKAATRVSTITKTTGKLGNQTASSKATKPPSAISPPSKSNEAQDDSNADSDIEIGDAPPVPASSKPSPPSTLKPSTTVQKSRPVVVSSDSESDSSDDKDEVPLPPSKHGLRPRVPQQSQRPSNPAQPTKLVPKSTEPEVSESESGSEFETGSEEESDDEDEVSSKNASSALNSLFVKPKAPVPSTPEVVAKLSMLERLEDGDVSFDVRDIHTPSNQQLSRLSQSSQSKPLSTKAAKKDDSDSSPEDEEGSTESESESESDSDSDSSGDDESDQESNAKPKTNGGIPDHKKAGSIKKKAPSAMGFGRRFPGRAV